MQSFVLFLTIFVSRSIYCQEGFDGTITNGYLKYFFNLSETNVVLSKREITNIDVGAFVDFYEIRRLDLSNNEIETLGDSVFYDQVNLEELDLSNNKLVVISRVTLRLLNKLRLILLENNRIIQADQKTFSGLANLKEICIYGNPVATLFPGSLTQISASNTGIVVTYSQPCAATSTLASTTASMAFSCKTLCPIFLPFTPEFY